MKKYLKRIYDGSADKFFEIADERILQNKKTFIITANAEILMKAENDKVISEMLLKSENIIIPDGISVIRAMKANGFDAKERVTGVDVCEHLMDTAGKNNLSVYLFGSSEEVVSTLAANYKEKYPEAVLNYHNGYDGDKDEIFEEIKGFKPDLVAVGMGVPFQELLINRHIEGFSKGVFIGVGGSFDVLSGLKKRAPKIFIKLRLEWLYRIAKEPYRLKRFWDNNIKFMRYMKKGNK